MTGSAALFAETLHTVADAGNEVFLYIAIRRSARDPDATHPLGYGPERYYWALLAAIGIFVHRRSGVGLGGRAGAGLPCRASGVLGRRGRRRASRSSSTA